MPIGIVCGIETLACRPSFHLRWRSFWILQMIYRGVEYRLVQSIAPKGWRWSFEYAGRQRSGHKSHREEAFVHLRRSIDQAIRRYDGPQPDSQPHQRHTERDGACKLVGSSIGEAIPGVAD
jgi:hypothetical protein